MDTMPLKHIHCLQLLMCSSLKTVVSGTLKVISIYLSTFVCKSTVILHPVSPVLSQIFSCDRLKGVQCCQDVRCFLVVFLSKSFFSLRVMKALLPIESVVSTFLGPTSTKH